MLLVNKIDAVFEKFWSIVGAALCGLTGRSNFFFARLLYVPAAGVLTVGIFLSIPTLEVLPGAFFEGAAFSQYVLYYPQWHNFLKRLQAEAEKGDRVLSGDFRTAVVAQKVSLAATVVIAGVFGPIPAVSLFLLTGSLYLATQNRRKKPARSSGRPCGSGACSTSLHWSPRQLKP